jgi:hypothetical protein
MESAAMPDTTISAVAKKETVYSGPSPQAQGTVYSGPASGSAGGTVYNGPGTGNTAYGGPAAGTVYKPPRPAAADGAKADMPVGASKGSGILFAIAGFSVVNTLLVLGGSNIVLGIGLTVSKFASGISGPGLILLNVIAVGFFALLGIFARSGSRAAILIGMLLYLGDGLMLFMSGDPSAHIPGLIVHGILTIGLFKSFSDLHD